MILNQVKNLHENIERHFDETNTNSAYLGGEL